MQSARRNLSEYVKRVMKLKGLTQKDVERMSGGRITAAYVGSITTGRADNLSVEKVQALAEGLGVELDELFHIACGLTQAVAARQSGYDRDALMILETLQEAVVSPDVTELLHEIVRLTPAERVYLLGVIKRLGSVTAKSRRKTKRTQAP